MNTLLNLGKRLGPLALIIAIATYFLVDKKFGDSPEIETLATYTHFPEPSPVELDVSPKSLALSAPTADNASFALPAIPKAVQAFGARNKEVRLILADFFGGGNDTEDAVEMALSYFARIQAENGGWDTKNKNGRPGPTGLAVLCFLGAGYNGVEHGYEDTVSKGLAYLMGSVRSDGKTSGNLYDTAIVATALCEAFALTGNTEYRVKAELMLDHMTKGQGPEGGWHYHAYKKDLKGFKYDTSVTGWVMMAFKSAKLAGIPVSKDMIEKYLAYSLKVTDDTGESFYNLNVDGTRKGNRSSMTASTLMCRLYMGHHLQDKLVLEGLNRLTKRLGGKEIPKWNSKGKMDNYLWYHAAQVAFLVGGDSWEKWNRWLRDLLVKNQIQEGDSKGSWGGTNFKWADRSAVYGDALNVLTLQTYYRYYH